MSSKGIWCEARCNFFVAGVGPGGRNACEETSRGAFGISDALVSARLYGWKRINGEWCCKPCQEAMKEKQ